MPAPLPQATLISVEEYLATSYRPDCDYVDGRIEERNLGEYDHSSLQTAIGAYFFARRNGTLRLSLSSECRSRRRASASQMSV